MPYKNPYPPVRISPIAKLHLASIVEAMKSKGLRTSEASFLTNLILSQPIPNGHAWKWTIRMNSIIDYQNIITQASDLADLTVEDLISDLGCQEANGELNIQVLEKALAFSELRGFKTVSKILKSYIKRCQEEK
jgi:hypothetical protein